MRFVVIHSAAVFITQVQAVDLELTLFQSQPLHIDDQLGFWVVCVMLAHDAANDVRRIDVAVVRFAVWPQLCLFGRLVVIGMGKDFFFWLSETVISG